MPDWEFYFENGKTFNRSGNYKEALYFFYIALTKKPQDADTYNERAFSLEHLGRLDEACRDLFFAFCINPHLHIKSDNPVVWINLCTLLEEHGDFGLVKKLINIATGRFPENEELLEQRARFLPDQIQPKNVPETHRESPLDKKRIVVEVQSVHHPRAEPQKRIEPEPESVDVLSSDPHSGSHPAPDVLFLYDYYPKKDRFTSGINPKHDFNSSRILNLKSIDTKNEAAARANKKYVLSKLDMNRITFFAEHIEPILQPYTDLVICVVPKSKKAREPSGIRMVAQKLCENHHIDGTDIIDRPVDRELRHLDGNRDYHEELAALRITDSNRIQGKTVFLLDDVKTQGNSLLAGQELLVSNGALQVIMFALGKTSSGSW
ncbi:MAG: hypothetical protein PHF57_05545 [Methanoregula sp.]|jgi:tetratricopeptide (TPR) repeat protein|nr:hypothetical protein [Methanoregula sp.]MDD5024330.1 hypothetical protein [Methanoregula sp.]MDD5187652.1 hypothetical protein [Methanoregula sp.]